MTALTWPQALHVHCSGVQAITRSTRDKRAGSCCRPGCLRLCCCFAGAGSGSRPLSVWTSAVLTPGSRSRNWRCASLSFSLPGPYFLIRCSCGHVDPRRAGRTLRTWRYDSLNAYCRRNQKGVRKPCLHEPWPLGEHVTLRPLPLLPPFHDPLLERLTLDAVDLAVGHHLKHGGQRRLRQAHGALLLGLRDIEVGRVVGAGGLHIQAVPPPIRVGDRHRAPLRHRNSVARVGEQKANITDQTLSTLLNQPVKSR